MNRKEERELKKLIRQKRLELAKKQTELSMECERCEKKGKEYRVKNCEGCSIFNQLQVIGQEFTNLSIGNFEIVRKETKQVTKVVEESKKLTVEVYKELKEQGMSDTKIMKQFSINNAKFYDWKRENGLIKDRVKKEKPTTKEQLHEFNDYYMKRIDELTSQNEKLMNEKKELLKYREENQKLAESNVKLQDQLEELQQQIKDYLERNKQLSINIVKANEMIEELREEKEKLAKTAKRGEFYMRLSLMLMEGILDELKEDAS